LLRLVRKITKSRLSGVYPANSESSPGSRGLYGLFTEKSHKNLQARQSARVSTGSSLAVKLLLAAILVSTVIFPLACMLLNMANADAAGILRSARDRKSVV
jgi:hypothetical protein